MRVQTVAAELFLNKVIIFLLLKLSVKISYVHLYILYLLLLLLIKLFLCTVIKHSNLE